MTDDADERHVQPREGRMTVADIHNEKATAVQAAVIDLYQLLAPQGMTSAALCEGAIKAAAMVMLGERGASLDDVAGILEDFAKALREGDELVKH